MYESKKINGFFAIFKNLNFKKNYNENLKVLEKSNEDKEKIYELLNEIEYVKNMLKVATNEFNNQTEKELIESSIYLVLSLETKLNYLIKEAKRKNIKYEENILMAG